MDVRSYIQSAIITLAAGVMLALLNWFIGNIIEPISFILAFTAAMLAISCLALSIPMGARAGMVISIGSAILAGGALWLFKAENTVILAGIAGISWFWATVGVYYTDPTNPEGISD